jgi:protein-S-isoprenylcysteine O-methyltransferase Ste14
VIWQIWSLGADTRVLVTHPTLAVAIGCLRSGLYVAFLSIPAVVLLLHDPPAASDDRILIRALAIVTTFFLILLGLLAPSGPVLFRVPLTGEAAALAMTLVGVALGVYAMATLGMNFSFWPEARRLVVCGPYRLVRHPVYFAEIIMSAGALILNLRLTMVLGEFIVVVLVIVRINVEERLLKGTFPTFEEFETATRHRLLPGIW